MARDTGTHLKGPCTKFHSQPLTLGFSRRRAERTRVSEEESGVCGPGETVEGSATPIHVESFPHTRDTILPGQSTPIHGASAWREAMAPRPGISLTSPCGLYTPLRRSAGSSFHDSLTGSQQVEAGRARTLGALGLLLNNREPGAGKSQPWCTAWSSLCAPRARRVSHKLWITDTSTQVPRVSHRQHMTLACIRVLPKSP